MTFLERLSALVWFLVAAAWFLLSDLVAARAASGLTFGDWYEPLYRIFLLFLLICGYSLMSRLSRMRARAGKSIGLDVRSGWMGEFGLGAALGWGGVVACVLPSALIGGLVITVFGNHHQIWIAVLDALALLAGTLAVEVAFRGYPFRKLVDAMGPVMGTFFMAVIFAIWRTHYGPTSTAAVLVSFLLGCVLAVAAMRTAALWVGWGFHFAWVAVMSLLFGLPMAGGMNYSPIFVTNAAGPGWVTGNGQGPEGSAFGVMVAIALLIVMVRATTDLKHKFGYPEIVPGGIPVDLDAVSRQQHEAAMAHAEPATPQLVQILPAAGGGGATPQSAAAGEPNTVPADELHVAEAKRDEPAAAEERAPGVHEDEPPEPAAS